MAIVDRRDISPSRQAIQAQAPEFQMGSPREIIEYIKSRERKFLGALEDVAGQLPIHPGWLNLGNGSRIFTGGGLCALASAALKDGLHEARQVPNTQSDIVQVAAPIVLPSLTHGGDDRLNPTPLGHVTYRVRLPGDALYVDATYGQVLTEAAGKIIIGRVRDNGFFNLYPSKGNTPNGYGNLTSSSERVVETMREDGLTDDMYRYLVESVKS